MDALALLCTLHADGPSTLVRLRAANCATLENVIASDVDALAMLLRSSRLAAGRFQKEARQLIERLVVVPTGATLEESATSDPNFGIRTGAERRRSTSRATSAAAGAPPAPTVVPARPASLPPSPMDRVLSAWREADAMEEVAPDVPQKAVTIPIAALDGLDAETAVALARAGVRNLESLAAADALTLSRATNISYSKLTRLRALARRQPAPTLQTESRSAVVLSDAASSKPVSTSERLSPSERPHAHAEPIVRFERDFVLEPIPSEEGVGGPFA